MTDGISLENQQKINTTMISTDAIIARLKDLTSNLCSMAAERLEELQLELTETIEELNHWQVEVTKERIKVERAHKLRKDAEIERDSLRDAMALDILELTMQRDEARAEVERLKNHIPDATKMIRPEPSRLEIAAQIYAAWWTNPQIELLRQTGNDRGDCFDCAGALEEADALIAAAREGGK